MTTNQSKERLLAAAKELFLARGYAATTVDGICEKAALTKGSLYYFFDSKEELGLAVLEWSLRAGVRMLADGPHVRIADPVEKAFAFLEHLEKCSPQLWNGGCLLGVFSQELAETNPRMQKAVAGMFQTVADDFAEELQPIAAQLSGKQAATASAAAVPPVSSALPARCRPQHRRDQQRAEALESPVLKCSPKMVRNSLDYTNQLVYIWS